MPKRRRAAADPTHGGDDVGHCVRPGAIPVRHDHTAVRIVRALSERRCPPQWNERAPALRPREHDATAFAALQNGRLPAGSEFPTGSLIFKEVLSSQSGAVDVWALMYKDRANSHAGDGWLWAEIRPSGAVVYSITDRGRACTGCHSLEQGPQNDLVRTFERQQ